MKNTIVASCSASIKMVAALLLLLYSPIFMAAPQTNAKPDLVVPENLFLDETSLIYAKMQGMVVLQSGNLTSLTPFIGKVEKIKTPGNKKVLKEGTLQNCFIVGYARLLTDYKVSLDRGVLYCKVRGGPYRAGQYYGATVDEGLNYDLVTQPLSVQTVKQLSSNIDYNIYYLQKLKAAGIKIDPLLEDTKTLPLQDFFDKATDGAPSKKYAFLQVPGNLEFGIVLKQPVNFPSVRR